MKRKFVVQMEAKISKDVEVEADSYEEAGALAKKNHTIYREPVELGTTWVETAEFVEARGELAHEIVGECVKCGNALLEPRLDEEDKHLAAHPDWPWYYGCIEKGNYHDNACYTCLESPLVQLARQAE